MNRVVKRATSSKRGSRAAGSRKKAKRASTTAATKKRATKKVAKKTTKRTAKKAVTKTRKTNSARKVTRGASAKKAGATRDSGRVGRATRSTKRTATAGANKTKTKKAARNATAKKATKKAGTVRVKTRKKRLGSKVSPAVTPSPTTQDPIQFFEETRRLPKTALTAKQLNEFRNLLLNKRRELIGDVRHLQRDAFPNSRSGGESSPMPIHMADLGSDNWEHEFTLGLIENEQGRIRMIDGALARIADKTYGVCLATHKRIGVVRLRAKPWAKYCIEYARACEEGRVP